MIDTELLRGVPAFVDVPAAGLESLAREARAVEYHPGARIIPLIKPPDQLFFLLEGLVKLVGISQTGNERIVYVFRPCEGLGSSILPADRTSPARNTYTNRL